MSPALGAPGSPLAFSPPPALGGGAGLTISISQESPRELRAFEQRSQGPQEADSKGGHTLGRWAPNQAASSCAKWSSCLPGGVSGV